MRARWRPCACASSFSFLLLAFVVIVILVAEHEGIAALVVQHGALEHPHRLALFCFALARLSVLFPDVEDHVQPWPDLFDRGQLPRQTRFAARSRGTLRSRLSLWTRLATLTLQPGLALWSRFAALTLRPGTPSRPGWALSALPGD
jgi:hypothetical protein